MKIGRIWRPGFFDQIIGKYQETRLGRQELSVAAAMEVLSRSPGFNNDNRSSAAIWSGPIETTLWPVLIGGILALGRSGGRSRRGGRGRCAPCRSVG